MEVKKELTRLYSWRNAWKYNDIDAYLNFYDTKFIKSDGMNYRKFSAYKKRVFKK